MLQEEGGRFLEELRGLRASRGQGRPAQEMADLGRRFAPGDRKPTDGSEQLRDPVHELMPQAAKLVRLDLERCHTLVHTASTDTVDAIALMPSPSDGGAL